MNVHNQVLKWAWDYLHFYPVHLKLTLAGREALKAKLRLRSGGLMP